MNYDRINNKILELIEENYSKYLLKTLKIIQIIIAGHRCSEHKSLKAFTDQGFETSLVLSEGDIEWLDFYVIRKLTQKICISIPMTECMKDRELYYNYRNNTKGEIYIHVDETDKIYKYIKLLENNIPSCLMKTHGNEAVRYIFHHEGDKKYKLTISYSAMM